MIGYARCAKSMTRSGRAVGMQKVLSKAKCIAALNLTCLQKFIKIEEL